MCLPRCTLFLSIVSLAILSVALSMDSLGEDDVSPSVYFISLYR